MKLVVAGDIHIGRASSAAGQALPADRRRTVAAWQAIVELAIAERAAAVCLTGDVVDESNKYFESAGPLQRGVQRLAEAGVAVFAVTGNHDHDVLPRVADELGEDQLCVLGRGGRWQRVRLQRDGAAVHLDGWSYPGPVVDQDPVASYELEPAPDAPTLVMVHGDLDAPGSRYAPLSRHRLRERPVAGWLLGHIHRPGHDDEASPFILYPGSPQAMDPGEAGVHGAWVVEVARGRVAAPRLVPLSSVRYEQLELTAEAATTEDELETLLRQRIRDEGERLAEESGQRLHCLSLRVRLTGRTAAYEHAEAVLARFAEQWDERVGADVTLYIDRVDNQLEPAIDLERCSADDSPLGAVARLLVALEQGQGPRELVQPARQRIRLTRHGSYYSGLPDEPPLDDALARAYLRHEAWRLLNDLHAQAEAGR